MEDIWSNKPLCQADRFFFFLSHFFSQYMKNRIFFTCSLNSYKFVLLINQFYIFYAHKIPIGPYLTPGPPTGIHTLWSFIFYVLPADGWERQKARYMRKKIRPLYHMIFISVFSYLDFYRGDVFYVTLKTKKKK